MSLKRFWFLVALNLLVVLTLNHLYLQIIWLSGLLFFLRPVQKKAWGWLLLFSCLIIFQQWYLRQLPQTFSGTIVKVNANNVIVQVKARKIIVNQIRGATLFEQLSFTGNYQKLAGPPSTFGFDKIHHYQAQGIFYEITPTTYQLSASSSWRYKLVCYLKQKFTAQNYRLIEETLFNSYENHLTESFLTSLLFSKSLLINGCVQLFGVIMGYFFPEKQTKLLKLMAVSLLSYFFGLYLIFWRFLLTNYFPFQASDRFMNWGFSTCFLLAIKPFYVFQVGFGLLSAISLLRCFSQARHWYTNYLAIIPLNLYYFYELDIFRLVAYPIVRVLALINFLLVASQLIWIKLDLLSGWAKLLSSLPTWELALSGQPNFIWLIIWFELASLFLLAPKIRYLAGLILLLVFNQKQLWFQPVDIVTYLYVGQGDCAIIQPAFSTEVIVIDTGNKYNYHYLTDYLKARGITTIRYLIITHQDEDHSGNQISLTQDFLVREIITTKKDFTFKNQQWSALLADQVYPDENDNSLIFATIINHERYLFLADISQKVEVSLSEQNSNLQADIVKVAHHGSKTGTSPTLYRHLAPKLAIISSGYQNYYGHPHTETLTTLNNYRFAYINTAEVGDIFRISLGRFQFVFTSSKQLFLF